MAKFKKGQSGNESGRPRNSKNKSTLMSEALKSYSDKNSINTEQSIVDVLIKQSLDGDIQATKLILDRIAPSLKPESQKIEIPLLPKNIMAKAGRILGYATNGTINPDQAKLLLSGLADLMKIKEVTEIEDRLILLEEQSNAQV